MMLSNEEFSENIKSCKIETKPQNMETITNTPTAFSALPVHDTKYYRDLLKENTASLNQQSCNWEKYSEVVAEDIGKENEELVLGDIRTTVGQAKLLIKERFTQFSGLIDKCEFGSSDKPVLCQDLEGFWEMINFQVVDVQEKFSKLEKRRSENWANNSEEKKTVKKKILKKKSVQPPDVSNADKRLEARKRLASAKAALKKKVPPSVTFDAGFFKVDSPVRSLTDKSRTPSTAERKRPATPSSDSFLHGRFLKRKMEVLGPDLKKSLNFDVTTMDNCTDQDADVPCQAPTSVKVTETRSISTETETNEFVVEKALMTISQQIALIQDSFRKKETNENASQTVPEIENPNTQDQNASFSNQDSYQDLYMKQLCKTQLLEAKLKQYTCLDATFPNYILKWRSTLEQMQRKVQQIESTSSRLRAWKDELTMIKQCENKELMDLKETCRQNIDKINLLKLNQVDFNELQLKYAKLEENWKEQNTEHQRLQEEYSLMRNERKELREKLFGERKAREELEVKFDDVNEQMTFEKEELTTENNDLLDDRKLLQEQLGRTEVMLQTTKDVFEKLQMEYNQQKDEIAELKNSQNRDREEKKSLQEELDITKANSRLAMLEQQEEVIASESKTMKLNLKFREFHQKLKTYLEGQEVKFAPDAPPVTPGKSLVVSTISTDVQDMDDLLDDSAELTGKPEENLFTRISHSTELMDDIMKISAQIAEHLETRILQLNSEKRCLVKNIESLRLQVLQHNDSKSSIELQLRKHLCEVQAQRDEQTNNWIASKNENKSLLERILKLQEENRKYKSHLGPNQINQQRKPSERRCLEELDLMQAQNR